MNRRIIAVGLRGYQKPTLWRNAAGTPFIIGSHGTHASYALVLLRKGHTVAFGSLDDGKVSF